jgi:hypothetical protein
MVLPDYIVEAIDRLPDDGGWNQIRAYLDAGGDVNDVDANGKTILNRILGGGTIPCEASLEFIRLLVQERGADVNKSDNHGRNALFFACNCCGQFGLDAVRLILDAGADIDAKTTRASRGEFIVGETPLSTAMDWSRHWDHERALAYASLLISRGASIDDCWGGIHLTLLGRTAEECLQHIEDPSLFFDQDPYDTESSEVGQHPSFIALKAFVADARRRKLRAPAKAALTLRTLALRGRAAPADPILKFIVDLPDGVAWNLVSYWPPRRYPPIIPASTYRGPRPGYVFTTRQGYAPSEPPVTGYHIDW